jgi:hypothetical protein
MAEAQQQAIITERVRQKPDYFGCLLGILTFFGGMALLLVTFKLAYEMFSIPPEKALKMPTEGAMNVNLAIQSFGWLIVQVFLLLVMGFIGSMIANRGIKLYLAGRQEIFDKPAVDKE